MINDGINFVKSAWEFNESVANTFQTHVRKSVPMYDKIHEMIGCLSEWFVEDNTNVYDIGTSNGECLRHIRNHNKNRYDISYIGIDNSLDMINKANEINTDITFKYQNITDDDFNIKNSNFVTSVLTLQFISKKERLKLIKKIYENLNVGGAFILVEKITAENSEINEIFIDNYYDFKKYKGFDSEEIINKRNSLRGVMKPNTESENIKLLTDGGFSKNEIFFKWFNFIGIISIK